MLMTPFWLRNARGAKAIHLSAEYFRNQCEHRATDNAMAEYFDVSSRSRSADQTKLVD